MTIVLQWFEPDDPISLEWFAQDGKTLAAFRRDDISRIAVVIGPQGPAGESDIDNYDPGDLSAVFQSF